MYKADSRLIISAMVQTEEIEIQTKGNCNIADITKQFSGAVRQSGIISGAVIPFNAGSTERSKPNFFAEEPKASFSIEANN